MFTGIVEDLGTVEIIRPGKIKIRTKLGGIKNGDSVMVDGVCLTAAETGKDHVVMDIGVETLRKTALTRLRRGSKVNLETSLTLSSKAGGHIVYGHVMEAGKVVSNKLIKNTRMITIKASREFLRKLMEKGSVAVNGVSLTVNKVSSASFSVGVIPETMRRTNLKDLNVSDRVNLEADMLIAAAKEK